MKPATMPSTSRQRDARPPKTRRSTVAAAAFCTSAACAFTQELGGDRDVSSTAPLDDAAASEATTRPVSALDSTSEGASSVLPSTLRLAAGDRFTCGVTGASAVAAGMNHTCAMTTGGVVRCWGLNYHGELGRDPGSSASTVLRTTWSASEPS